MTKRHNQSSPHWAAFPGYAAPRYTQVPDQLLDEHLAYLSGPELKVLLFIIRRTFGWKKDEDAISLSQMLRGIWTKEGQLVACGVGLSKPTLLAALRNLAAKNLIETERQRSSERGDEPTIYRLRISTESRGQRSDHPVVKNLYQGGGQESSPGPWSNTLTTQETLLQETKQQEIHLSNIRRVQTSQNTRGHNDTHQGIPARNGSSRRFHTTITSETASDDATPASHATDRREGNGRTSSDRSESSRTGFSSVAAVLDGNGANGASPGRVRRQKAYPDDRQAILGYIQDFAIELGDEAPLASSVSRAYNLYQRTGIPMARFIAYLYEARSLTQEYTASVKKQRQGKGGPFGPAKNKMPYYFSILEELVTGQHGKSPPGQPAPS